MYRTFYSLHSVWKLIILFEKHNSILLLEIKKKTKLRDIKGHDQGHTAFAYKPLSLSLSLIFPQFRVHYLKNNKNYSDMKIIQT